MSQGNKKVQSRKILVTNKEFLVCTHSLIQPTIFKEIPATNYEILVRTGTGTRDSLFHGCGKHFLFHMKCDTVTHLATIITQPI